MKVIEGMMKSGDLKGLPTNEIVDREVTVTLRSTPVLKLLVEVDGESTSEIFIDDNKLTAQEKILDNLLESFGLQTYDFGGFGVSFEQDGCQIDIYVEQDVLY